MAPLDLPGVIGHRGAAAVAPENTLGGFRKAAALGVRWVEFDVRLARDGECILLHDDTLERTSNGRGDAGALAFDELRRLDAGGWFGADFAGERIPTLGEAIALLAELGMGANIEIKPAPGTERATGEAVASLVRGSWPSSLPPPLLSSFRPAALEAARRTAPELARGILFDALPADWRRQADVLECRTVHCNHKKLLPAQAAAVRGAGFPLLAYTVNERDRAEQLRQWGVVAVFSDCPHLLLAGGALDGAASD